MASMEYDIQSPKNSRVKDILRRRRHASRSDDGGVLIEGTREVQRALTAGLRIDSLLYCPDLMDTTATDWLSSLHNPAITRLSCSRAAFERAAYREGPDGVLAIGFPEKRSLKDLKLSTSCRILIADRIEKPGNLGALLRTADGAGLDAVLLSDSEVDPWNPNVIRASTGVLFSQPPISASADDIRAWLKQHGVRLIIACPDADTPYMQAHFNPPVAVAVGAEDTGLSDAWKQAAHEQVSIPMMGQADSLNVSVAGGLLAYETLRWTEQDSAASV